MFDSNETLLIGVDGGGTGCRVAIGSRSKGVLAEVAGGSANVASDMDGALTNILSAVREALVLGGLDAALLSDARAHLGLAGVLTSDIGQAVANGLPFKNCVVTEDRATTVMGALDGQDGFVAAIGTGSFIAASKGGQQRFVGGWGNRVSDQAGGCWLGRKALSKTLLCYDGVFEHSDLTRAFMGRFDDDPAEVSAFSLRASPAEFGQLCPMITDAAQAGDPIAVELMTAGATFIVQALRSLKIEPGDVVVLSGGLGGCYKPYVQDKLPNPIQGPKMSAMMGAFKLALQAECNAAVMS